MINLIQPITVQQAYDGITHARRWASWNWWWRMVDDDDGDGFPSPEPRTDSRSALPRGFRAWRRLRIVKRDESFSLIFFSPNVNIWSWSWGRWSIRGPTRQGSAPRGGGAPPPSWTGCGAPGLDSFANIFYIFQNWLSWSFRTFGVVQNRSLIFAPFPAQNSSCRHSPSSCKPCKIRENRHKYCDIMCNNSP